MNEFRFGADFCLAVNNEKGDERILIRDYIPVSLRLGSLGTSIGCRPEERKTVVCWHTKSHYTFRDSQRAIRCLRNKFNLFFYHFTFSFFLLLSISKICCFLNTLQFNCYSIQIIAKGLIEYIRIKCTYFPICFNRRIRKKYFLVELWGG